jgi:hypothetical protein
MAPPADRGKGEPMNVLLLAAFLMNPTNPVELRVTFYDNSRLGRESRTKIFAEAERILRKAGVNVEWTEGDPAEPQARLIQYPERPRKGRETDAACRALAYIALELLSDAPKGFKQSVLGIAQPFATAGLNVRLFMERIEATALSVQQSAAVVGGHVLAHEISHVFLRTLEHSNSGLMAALWGNHEYSRMLTRMLLLSEAQAETIRFSLNRTGCRSPADESGRVASSR